MSYGLAGILNQQTNDLLRQSGQDYGNLRSKRQSYGNLAKALSVAPEDEDERLTMIKALSQAPEIAEEARPYLTMKQQKSPLGAKSVEELQQVFESVGMSPEEAAANAKLYSNLTVGGQTAHAQSLIDRLQRGGLNPAAGGQEGQFEGLTPKESASRRTKLFDSNEPKLVELGNKLESYETEDTRFSRLEELSKANDLPNRFTTALFTKDGELHPLATSGLSEDAQEFLKLLADNISGAKDTFGSRVTNFDLQTYMKRLPSLLNSPEGRSRVLKDLRTINAINRLEAEAVMGEFEEAGGVDRIPYSVAQRRAKEKIKDQVSELRREFIHPTKQPDGRPAAAHHKGRKIRNPETGEVLESDGKEWIKVQ